MMEIIKEEFKGEYIERTSEIRNVIIKAYSDYYNLVHMEPYLEKYKARTVTEAIVLLPARNFMNSIVRTIQEEFILIVCSLENKDDKANSITQLKAKLHNYLVNFDSYKDGLLKMPPDDDNIKEVRNTAIAHINLNINCEGIYTQKVKDRLNILKNCFNSYLFGDATKYKIDDNLIEKIETESRIGVQQLFYGFVNWICNR